jgi:hypothetical protein
MQFEQHSRCIKNYELMLFFQVKLKLYWTERKLSIYFLEFLCTGANTYRTSIKSIHFTLKQIILNHSSPSGRFRPVKIANFLGRLDHVCALIKVNLPNG